MNLTLSYARAAPPEEAHDPRCPGECGPGLVKKSLEIGHLTKVNPLPLEGRKMATRGTSTDRFNAELVIEASC